MFRSKNELEKYFFSIFGRHGIFENSKNKFIAGLSTLKNQNFVKTLFPSNSEYNSDLKNEIFEKTSSFLIPNNLSQTFLENFDFSDFFGIKSEISHLRFFECNYEMVRRRRLLTSISLRKSYLVPRSFDLILKSVASDCDVISRKTIKSSVRLSSGLSV